MDDCHLSNTTKLAKKKKKKNTDLKKREYSTHRQRRVEGAIYSMLGVPKKWTVRRRIIIISGERVVKRE
jgi:hypothetical protein